MTTTEQPTDSGASIEDRLIASFAPEAAEPAAPADDDPPTRAELEEQAAKLGIKVDGRWSDKRLTQAIADAMKE